MASPSTVNIITSLSIDWDDDHGNMMRDDLSATSHDEASKVFEQWQTDTAETLMPSPETSSHILQRIDAPVMFDSVSLDMMDVVDEDHLCSNLLEDDDAELLFSSLPMSSAIATTTSHSPFADLVQMTFDYHKDIDHFSLSLLTDDSGSDDSSSCGHSNSSHSSPSSVRAADDDNYSFVSSLPFEVRYQATLAKLADSMKRSQETRMSLKMETPETQQYYSKAHKSLTSVLERIECSTNQLLQVHQVASSRKNSYDA